MDAKGQLEQLYVLHGTGFNPQQHVIHKPMKSGNGAALKIQLRLEPKWVATENGGYFDRESNKEGGLFFELAPQTGEVDGGGNPTFAWKDKDVLVRAKLGIPDITALLIGIREYRKARVDVPSYLRGKAQEPNQVTLFHKTPSGGSTIITLTFGEESSILQVSKGKDLRRSIALSLSEELILEKYLDLALEAFLRVGKK